MRSRVIYVTAVCVVIVAGLLSRTFPALGKYPGDALWALMVFFGLGVVFRSASAWKLGLAALAISWTVEFGQLYHTPWLDGFRATTIGHLILGSGFLPMDLAAYSVGVGVGVILELCFYKARGS